MNEPALKETAPSAPPLTAEDVRAAAARIAGSVVRTPTMHSRTLSQIAGAEIYLKFENHQFTAAYKERGALNAMLLLTEEQRRRGVIAASAGNHSQGLSYHGTRLGIPVTIVMPRTTPMVKVMQTEAVGGTVVLEGDSFDEASAHAGKLQKELGLTYVHPFDDPQVAAGQGTVALEMLEDVPDLDVLAIPVGGGGLATGMGTIARAINPDIRLIGVEAELYPSMFNLLKGATRPVGGDTLAEGIAVFEPGKLTSTVLADLLDDFVLVGEHQIESALALLLQIEKTVVEGAGAAGLAAVMAYPQLFAGKKVGIVLSGGNIDTRLLANVLLRDLARSGRLARLRLVLQDRPGSLLRVAKVFYSYNVNIIEIVHQRVFTHLPAKGLATEIECEARDSEQLDALVDALRAEGFEVSQMELN
ncbi:MAG TPA: threonine ammonia-lyase [Novosphingobium sp.]|nr:threonine ammonia-lyase [Novosphingobium sp.]